MDLPPHWERQRHPSAEHQLRARRKAGASADGVLTTTSGIDPQLESAAAEPAPLHLAPMSVAEMLMGEAQKAAEMFAELDEGRAEARLAAEKAAAELRATLAAARLIQARGRARVHVGARHEH